ncbi:Lrp/AsnC family transcriptional regulator [Pelagibius sp. Alg239-R121]|uniref:Lrp/AsnC family transcriptional regulator n=1 Tax=Pelagibius sp. Alg239-R121 TaxID=2993448 RepID=UPI0024A6549A|nr:Lrp/AsnC family transcriptional regulator [Pelagibius sp. Alg239-R121]
MSKETNELRSNGRTKAVPDAKDRMLLRLLSQDATASYADLGERIHLSPPAVHERVKRLKRDGYIKATVALLDGEKIGRPLLSFIHVDTSGWGAKSPMRALAELDEVEEIHTVTGDTCVVLKVRMPGTQALEDLLARIYKIDGVKGTRSYVVLSTYLERGPS